MKRMETNELLTVLSCMASSTSGLSGTERMACAQAYEVIKNNIAFYHNEALDELAEEIRKGCYTIDRSDTNGDRLLRANFEENKWEDGLKGLYLEMEEDEWY